MSSTSTQYQYADVVVIGAGAAGLMAAIFAGRTNRHRRIVVLDSARKLGAKILVAGGGRCNVTHDEISPEAYAGSSRNAIRKIIRRFDVPPTVRFFAEIGVELKREETGKLFPITDDAQTVLNALLSAARNVGVEIQHPKRVENLTREERGFCITGEWGSLSAGKIILASGGKSLPKSGSDGHGFLLAKGLGHSITSRVFPALTPLLLPTGHFLCRLQGITTPTTLTLWDAAGKKGAEFTGSMLCTHFGLSGPCVLDMSRYYIDATWEDTAHAHLTVNLLPSATSEQFERDLLTIGHTSVGRYLSGLLPDRLARALIDQAELDFDHPANQLTRQQRQALVRQVTTLPLPISGYRGYTYAEVTAGGVPLAEIRLETMESRLCDNLHFCGEICDVDGRIGGYNFQWAWSSGYVAGISV